MITLAAKQRWIFTAEDDLIFVAEIMPDVSKFRIVQIVRSSSNSFWSWVEVGAENHHSSLIPRTLNSKTNEPTWQYMLGQEAP